MPPKAASPNQLTDAESRWIDTLRRTGARIAIEMSNGQRVDLGDGDVDTVVRLRDPMVERAFWRQDPLRLAEGFLDERIVIEGSVREVFRVADTMPTDLGAWQRARTILRFVLSRRRATRQLATEHYDRPFDFFRPWLGRTRSYTHGLFDRPSRSLDEAQDAKLARALSAVAPEKDGKVLDVGCGWGSFLEYAGAAGVAVDGITVSEAQTAFIRERIERKNLPCEVYQQDFFEFQTRDAYSSAVFMGSLEHLVDTRRVARHLKHLLRPGGRVWADFCAQAKDRFAGEFITRHVWPGPAMYVHLPSLIRDFEHEGFTIQEVSDDTTDYARTVEIWANRLESARGDLSLRHGRDVRLFQLLLRGSQHFLETRQTLAYHVIMERHAE